MNCTEFERILHRMIETRRPADLPSLREHAAVCANCRTLWEQYAVLERAIPLWKERPPKVDLTDAVLARVAADGDNEDPPVPQPPTVRQAREEETSDTRTRRATTSRRRAWRFAAVLAIGTAVLVLFVRSVMLPTGNGRQAPEGVARNVPKVPSIDKPQPPNEPEVEIDTLLRDASAAYLGLARGAADSFAEVKVLALAGDPRGPRSGEPGLLPTAPPTWLKHWQRDLEPIEENLQEAVDRFFDALLLETAPAT